MKRKRQHKSLKVFLALLFASAMALTGAVALAPDSFLVSADSASGAVEYMAWDETSRTVKSVDGGCTEYTVVSASDTAWTEGWYVVSSNVEIDARISVSGTVNLILCDLAELKANQGIGLSNAQANINIYAQSTGDNAGKLTATSGEDTGAIGGGLGITCGNIVINGGVINAKCVVDATYKSGGAGIGGGRKGEVGDITINGGVINATGVSDGAGIGCGGTDNICGNITVNGGTIIATGGENGAGIGASYYGICGIINIKGGTITAKGGKYGSGIGTGFSGDDTNVEGIVIEGGVIDATGGERSAGIGTGYMGMCGPVEITGGTITANGGSEGPGIGCRGGYATIESITIAKTVGLLTVNKGPGATYTIGSGGEYDGECGPITIGGNTFENIDQSPYVYPVFQQVTLNTNGGEIVEGNITQYVEGVGATLPTAVIKDKAFFDGWYDNEDLTGEPVTEITAEATGEQEFYAKWAKAITITYHLNGGEWPNGISAPTVFKEGERFDLFGTDCIIPVKAGFVFYGWHTSDTLDEESRIEIIQDDVTNDVELWAEWGLAPVMPMIEDIFPTAGETEHNGEVVTVTATVNENGFVLDKTHSITITLEEGWFPDDAIYLIVADGYEYNAQPEYMTSEYEYNEQFITSSWGVVYQGGYSDDYSSVPAIGTPRPFDFEAFDGSITVTLSDEYSEKSLAFKQIHVTAQHLRTVTYNVNGGTIPGEYPTKYLEGTGLDELAEPTRNGYAFQGWYESADFEGDPVTKITVADTGNKEYFAKWEFIEVVDLSELTEDVTIYDGQTITGELQDNVKVTIADGATVTLKDVIIEGENDHAYAFAGITLEGEATLILEGNNTVKGFDGKHPGIYVPENNTLTIGGNGTLDVSSNGYAAGIGAGFDIPCGNIVIEGGTINATGGSNSAGIGGGNNSGSCGTITIKGGVVSATGGDGGAGIGGGEGSDCGDITITDKAKKVTATSGNGAPNSIGSGRNGNPVRVTIAGEVYEEGISDPNFVYSSATAEEFAALIEDLGTVEYSEAYKEKLEQAREMYNYLSDEEKEKVAAATLKVLEDAEKEYKNLEDGAKADETTDVIDALPSDITIDDKAAVEAARAAYEALTDDQQEKVDPEAYAKLEAAEKEINDLETSNQVTEAINNLPSIDEITPASKDAIEAGRKAYDDLSEEAKKKVSKETIDKLETAELTLAIAIFDEEFEKIPANPDEITSADKEAIEAARAAYNALTDEQKAQFPQDKLEKLKEAELALAYVTFNEEFAKIPANPDDITSADKEAIEAARAAYNALTDDQKSQFPQDKLDKLKEAELALAYVTFNEEFAKIPANSDEITSADREAIEAARAAYDALTDEQKAQFPQDKLDKLKEAELALSYVTFNEEFAKIPANPDEITSADREAIEAARAAYNALTDEQKAQFPQDKLDKLKEAESALAVITVVEAIDALPSSDEITTADKEAIEAARAAYDALTDEEKAKVGPEKLAEIKAAESALAVSTVAETIEALPSSDEITTADKEAIEAARASYNALNEEQKSQFPQDELDKLKEAESALAVSTANESINALPSSNEITTADKEAIEAARASYDALTEEEKEKVSPETLTKLKEAESALEVEEVVELIKNIGSVENNEESKERIEAARAAYDNLSEDQKTKIKAEDLQTLVGAEKAYDDLVNPKTQAPVALLVVVFILLIPALLMLAYLILYITKKKGSTVMSVVGLPVALAAARANGVFVALYVLVGLLVVVVVADVIIAIKNPQAIKDIKKIKQLFKKDAKNDPVATETAPLAPTQPVEATEPIAEERQEEVKVAPAAEKSAPVAETETEEEGEEAVTVTDESGNLFQIRFLKSFSAKLIQSSDETKGYYRELKNEILSYKSVKGRLSWHCESFHSGRAALIKLGMRGKTLCVYYALDAGDYENTKYKVEPCESSKYAAVPCMYRIKNARRCKFAKELIAAIAEKFGLVRGIERNEEYPMPYEENEPLLQRGLIKELKIKVEEPAPVDDESGNLFQIRFLKSFAAKLIQSSDEAKGYYRELKNEILSYKSVKGRLSWHCESFHSGRAALIKLGMRGKTLCVYYALDAGDYENTKYKVEPCESSKYAAVPCMYRIKNARRCKFAKELIAALAEKFGLVRGIERNEEYPMPYEENESLLQRGLIKATSTELNNPRQ